MNYNQKQTSKIDQSTYYNSWKPFKNLPSIHWRSVPRQIGHFWPQPSHQHNYGNYQVNEYSQFRNTPKKFPQRSGNFGAEPSLHYGNYHRNGYQHIRYIPRILPQRVFEHNQHSISFENEQVRKWDRNEKQNFTPPINFQEPTHGLT